MSLPKLQLVLFPDKSSFSTPDPDLIHSSCRSCCQPLFGESFRLDFITVFFPDFLTIGFSWNEMNEFLIAVGISVFRKGLKLSLSTAKLHSIQIGGRNLPSFTNKKLANMNINKPLFWSLITIVSTTVDGRVFGTQWWESLREKTQNSNQGKV